MMNWWLRCGVLKGVMLMTSIDGPDIIRIKFIRHIVGIIPVERVKEIMFALEHSKND